MTWLDVRRLIEKLVLFHQIIMSTSGLGTFLSHDFKITLKLTEFVPEVYPEAHASGDKVLGRYRSPVIPLARCKGGLGVAPASSRAANKNKPVWVLTAPLLVPLWTSHLDQSSSLAFVARLSLILFFATHPRTHSMPCADCLQYRWITRRTRYHRCYNLYVIQRPKFAARSWQTVGFIAIS